MDRRDKDKQLHARTAGLPAVAAISSLVSAFVVISIQSGLQLRNGAPAPRLATGAASVRQGGIPAGFQVDFSKMRAQGEQDKWVFENIFQKRPLVGEGFFIEFGARDGVEHSNTYFFEKALGWRGILLEVLPSEQKQIALNRPGAAIVDGGVCEYDGTVEILEHYFEGYGGRASTYDESRAVSAVGAVPVVNAACYRLETLVAIFGVRRVNYLSVDIEGSELLALKSFPWRNVVADVVGVEVLVGNPSRQRKEDEIVSYMKSVGYKVGRHHLFANDTKDVFFLPAHPSVFLDSGNGGLGGAMVDTERFAAAKDICRRLRRCLS